MKRLLSTAANEKPSSSTAADESKTAEKDGEQQKRNILLPSSGLMALMFGVGLASCGGGLLAGDLVFNGAAPIGIALASVLPVAATVYIPPNQLTARLGLLGLSPCLLGISASSMLSVADWPYFCTAAMILAPAFATVFSTFHYVEAQADSSEAFSAPTSPFSQALQRVGLWNASTPWAHAAFRNTFKLYFYYSAFACLPLATNLYGGWQVWLVLLSIWKVALTYSASAIVTGFSILNLQEVAPNSSIPLRLRPWGRWLLHNHFTNTSWNYAFYGAPAALIFYMWYKWKYGVSASPFYVDQPDTN